MQLTAPRTLTGHTSIVWSVALSADGQTLVSGSGDSTIKVWNLSSGKEVRTLTGHTGYVWSVALSADGQTLVSGSDDKTIKVWGT
jgi:WD40 repeat protein